MPARPDLRAPCRSGGPGRARRREPPRRQRSRGRTRRWRATVSCAGTPRRARPAGRRPAAGRGSAAARRSPRPSWEQRQQVAQLISLNRREMSPMRGRSRPCSWLRRGTQSIIPGIGRWSFSRSAWRTVRRAASAWPGGRAATLTLDVRDCCDRSSHEPAAGRCAWSLAGSSWRHDRSHLTHEALRRDARGR